MTSFQTAYTKETQTKWFGIKIYKLCGSKGYTYNMSVYLGRDRKRATATMTENKITQLCPD
jgi:hypothetical protein